MTPTTDTTPPPGDHKPFADANNLGADLNDTTCGVFASSLDDTSPNVWRVTAEEPSK